MSYPIKAQNPLIMSVIFLQVPRLTNELTSQHVTECLVETSSLENVTVTKLIDKDDILVCIYLVCKIHNAICKTPFIFILKVKFYIYLKKYDKVGLLYIERNTV